MEQIRYKVIPASSERRDLLKTAMGIKKQLKDLNLLDDFLFGSVVTYPEIGESFSRELLKIIFQKEFGKLVVVPQKTYYGSDTDKHGARLDVYLEEDLTDHELFEMATIYDIEPNQVIGIEDREALPKRVRFYHAKIDAKALKAGDKYQFLKNVIVVMITPFDPFGHGLMVYTVQNGIKELPDVEYNDGAKTLFLYTKGQKNNSSEELQQLLQYMEHTTEENAKTETLKKIHRMIETVKEDEEVSLEYMKILEREEMLIREGRWQGQEIERKNTERERQRADAAIIQAEEATMRADEAIMRANVAEKEIERLRKKLKLLEA